jgi:hypothetical protein
VREVTVRHANAWHKQLFKIIDDNPSAITHAVIAAELASKALRRALDGIRARREYLMD